MFIVDAIKVKNPNLFFLSLNMFLHDKLFILLL